MPFAPTPNGAAVHPIAATAAKLRAESFTLEARPSSDRPDGVGDALHRRGTVSEARHTLSTLHREDRWYIVHSVLIEAQLGQLGHGNAAGGHAGAM